MKSLHLKIFCVLLYFVVFNMYAQNTTHLSVLFKIDSINVTDKIDKIIIITNDSIFKKVTIANHQSNLFDVTSMPYSKNTFLFIEYKRRVYFITETEIFKMVYLNNPQKDTLFVELQYCKSPTKNILWDCRRSNQKIEGCFMLSYINEHIEYSYPIFNRKKYFRKNKKFLKYTLKGKDFEFEMKQCR